jgi:eukaryotic-like serine/threonine-protein kinase
MLGKRETQVLTVERGALPVVGSRVMHTYAFWTGNLGIYATNGEFWVCRPDACRPPVVHRDIKPENIVVCGRGAEQRVLLVDFGAVQAALTSDSSFGTTVVGTAGYMPPEQFGGAATVASDLYALGGVLLFLLSGRSPGSFGSERLRVAWEKEVQVNGRLRKLLKGLLEPMAEDRITAAQVYMLV